MGPIYPHAFYRFQHPYSIGDRPSHQGNRLGNKKGGQAKPYQVTGSDTSTRRNPTEKESTFLPPSQASRWEFVLYRRGAHHRKGPHALVPEGGATP